jgi:hypothetical protein
VGVTLYNPYSLESQPTLLKLVSVITYTLYEPGIHNSRLTLVTLSTEIHTDAVPFPNRYSEFAAIDINGLFRNAREGHAEMRY